jgi:sialic acid synthase SpsE
MQHIQFVAEVSSNHHRDLDRCLQFIDESAAVGCSAVKFQLFKLDKLFTPEALAKYENLEERRNWELPGEFLPDLAGHCRKRGIAFSCTPFYLEAVEELLPYVDFYKIASYELLWDDLLKVCAATGKPVVLATGMATLDEVKRAVTVTRAAGCKDLTLLHCVSSYPAPAEQCNLAAMKTISEACDCPVGWSDHSVDPGVILRAVFKWGAPMIEFHFDLEGEGAEFGAGHCWLPDQIEPVIRMVNTGFAADGAGEKAPVESESADREWRADPSDGLRPLLSERRRLVE